MNYEKWNNLTEEERIVIMKKKEENKSIMVVGRISRKEFNILLSVNQNISKAIRELIKEKERECLKVSLKDLESV